MLHVPPTLVPITAQAALDDGSEKTLWEHTHDRWGEYDPATLEPRRWLYGRHYLEGVVSATIADGGVGKSTLALTEAIAIVTGRPLLGITPLKEFWEGKEQGRQVLYYNAEETAAEIKRRVFAICQHFNIDLKELDAGNSGLTILSGHDYPLVLGMLDGNNVTFSGDFSILDEYNGDAIIFDPFVSVHQCGENNNGAIDAIVKRLGRTASTNPVKAVELVHHSRKPNHGSTAEISVADARGASSLVDAARCVRMLNRMTTSEALRAKVNDPRCYFRVDSGKANYAAGTTPSSWYRHVSVLLPNGDDVGVIVPWQMPGAFDGVTNAHMHQVRELARGGQYRADPRADEWIGGAVADVLNLDVEAEADTKRIKAILKEWYRTGALKKVEKMGLTRHLFMYVEPGELVEP